MPSTNHTTQQPSALAISVMFGGLVGLVSANLLGVDGGIGFFIGTGLVFLVLLTLIINARTSEAIGDKINALTAMMIVDQVGENVAPVRTSRHKLFENQQAREKGNKTGRYTEVYFNKISDTFNERFGPITSEPFVSSPWLMKNWTRNLKINETMQNTVVTLELLKILESTDTGKSTDEILDECRRILESKKILSTQIRR
jgi:hypothetical protein